MTRHDRQPIPPTDPVARFLGPGAAFNGPFGVLGLPVADVDEPAVLDALHRVMAKIDAHPEARTPAADEARLAAHAAAANLLDHAVRRELLNRLGAPTTRPPAPAHGTAPPSPATLQADLLRCIAIEGGWNSTAMRRFVKIAHERGFSTAEAIDATKLLRRPTGPGTARATPPQPAEPAAPDRTRPARQTPSPGIPDPAQPRADKGAAERQAGHGEPEPGSAPRHRNKDNGPNRDDADAMSPVAAVFLTIVVFGVIAAGVWGVWTMNRPTPRPPTPAPAPVVSVPAEPEPVRPAPAPPAAADHPLDNAPAIIHELEVATDAAAIDPDAALDTFAAAVGALSRRWAELAPVDHLAARDQIIGFIYRIAGRSDTIERAMSAIESGAAMIDGPAGDTDGISRAVWSTGMLVRLRREQNLPGTIIRRIDSMLLGMSVTPSAPTFRAGAVAALRSIAVSLSRPPFSAPVREAWGVWPRVVHAAAEGDGALEESLLIHALEGLLRLGETGGAADEIISGLIAEMNWRPDGAARVWLIRAFDDRSIDPDDLHVITLALATVSKAEGVDHSMVLPRGASEFDRRRLREVFRERWEITGRADQTDTTAAFAAAAREALLHDPTENRDDAEILASIVRLARLNAAGESAWRARGDTAAALLGGLDDPVIAVLGSDTPTDTSALFTHDEGTWAETYLAEGSHIPRRLDLLEKLAARQGRLGTMEAEVLVTEALRGSPRRVRDRAAGVAELFIDRPTIVNAVLEALPLMPRTDRNAKIVELAAGVPLPPVESPDWPARARRAVVERLLQLIAGLGPYARLDALAGLLDEAYGIQRSGSIAGLDPSGNTPPPPAGVSARVLAEQWAALASRRAPAALEGYAVDEIEHRRRARLAMADGLVQRFHAEQLALAELMAQVVAAEQPGAAGHIAALLDTLRTRRSRDRNVLIQIERAERFMLRLRLIRFGDEPGEDHG